MTLMVFITALVFVLALDTRWFGQTISTHTYKEFLSRSEHLNDKFIGDAVNHVHLLATEPPLRLELTRSTFLLYGLVLHYFSCDLLRNDMFESIAFFSQILHEGFKLF